MGQLDTGYGSLVMEEADHPGQGIQLVVPPDAHVLG
jgi:hypothetical protein